MQFEKLPVEMLFSILKFLPPHDLLTLALVSKNLKICAENDVIWKQLLLPGLIIAEKISLKLQFFKYPFSRIKEYEKKIKMRAIDKNNQPLTNSEITLNDQSVRSMVIILTTDIYGYFYLPFYYQGQTIYNNRRGSVNISPNNELVYEAGEHLLPYIPRQCIEL